MSEPSHDSSARGREVRVEIEPFQTEEDAAESLAGELTGLPGVRDRLPGGGLRLEEFRLLDRDGGEDARFRAVVHDADSYQSVQVLGRLGDLGRAEVSAVLYRPLPDAGEFERAVAAVRADPELGMVLRHDGAHVYRPMPPLADIQNPEGTAERVVTVGLRDPGAEIKHRIVGVRMRDLTVVHAPPGVTGPARHDCETTPGVDDCSDTPGHRAVRVRVLAGGTALWDLVVVRPRSSSGTNGSGAELRFVDYRGTRVLHRAHLPILNVEYGSEGAGIGCGPTYRDWQNQEACFTAEGSDPAGPGYRLCASAPATILDSGSDTGNFRGVAFHHDGSELRIVSELAAGWYRYISDWRLADDGVIRPRFGFAGVTNPCTCRLHSHHAYWRLDFDIAGSADDRVDEYSDPPVFGGPAWRTLQVETRRTRNPLRRRQWRVLNRSTGQGYHLVPGPHDGTADAYGAGDLWAVRYRGTELDDGQGFTTDPALSRARIDGFVTGEPIDGHDVVLWYGGHFRHDEHDPTPRPHIVGPDLYPIRLC
ncbi:hypothetical protein [Streptomyces sp. NPDC046712]|uniref:hypothetical protein n=1 Tax=Streptomyces sp. NPDC046712 TaxID=3154802 RepID=UPI0033D01463